MFLHATVGLVFCALLASALGVADTPGQTSATNKPAADVAAKAVSDDLERFKASGFVMQEVKDDPVGRAFPNHVFIGVYFRQFPVARLTPKGLNDANLYAVGPDAKPLLVKDAPQLRAFFKASLAPAKEESAAKDAARAYVRLLEELHQDGFYKFAPQEDSTKTEAGDEGRKASARAVVMAGGNGEITGTLTFDQAGSLRTTVDSVQLKQGPRPICQATKLLDADPIVRRMAERDLIIMGRATGPYLAEQRAKAAPELQRAIDHIWQEILKADR